ncbi:MAG: hypothetical protein R2710_27090, partial [Acidimicrobiales bacterium]
MTGLVRGSAVPSVDAKRSLRPQSVVLLVVALAPFDGLLLIARLPRVVDAWKEALVAFAFGLAVLEWPTRPRRNDRPPWAVPAIVLVAWSLVSVAVHPSLQSVLGFKISYTFLLLPLTLFWCPFDGRDRDRLVSVLMFGGFVTSVVGIAQQLVGHEALNRMGYEYNEVIRFAGDYLRSFSTFNQPFPFAFFVMIVILVGLPVALEDRGRRRNQLFLAALPVLFFGMSTAIVRGAFLGLALGLVYLGIVRYRVLGHGLFALPVIVLIVVASGAGGAIFSASSLQERATGWVSEVGSQGVHPIGEGIGSTGAAAEKLETAASGDGGALLGADTGPQRYQADNQYVKTWIELGPIGLWLLLWVLGAAAVHGHRVARSLASEHGGLGVSRDAGLGFGIVAATIAPIGAGTVATYWEIFPVDLLFWLL